MESQSDPSKKSPRRNSNSHLSISDTDSTTSPADCWHSPLRSESPLRSDDPCFYPENDGVSNKNSKPLPSPGKSSLSETSPISRIEGWRRWPQSEKPVSRKEDMIDGEAPVKQVDLTLKPNPPVVYGVNKLVKEEPAQIVNKVERVSGGGGFLEERHGGRRDEEVGGAVNSISRISNRHGASLVIPALTLRVLATIICLISFSVMASDKTQGWSGDSFDRYTEYRFCLAVNVIGFVYSSFQGVDLASRFLSKKYNSTRLRYCFDFSIDQILAYLLVSASSSAATRVNDWILNWGRDEFTTKASLSIAMSFLAFIVFGLSSLVSGYNLCNFDST